MASARLGVAVLVAAAFSLMFVAPGSAQQGKAVPKDNPENEVQPPEIPEGMPVPSLDEDEFSSTSTGADADEYQVTKKSDGATAKHFKDGKTVVHLPKGCGDAEYRYPIECLKDGDSYRFYQLQIVLYSCPTDPKLRRIVISSKPVEPHFEDDPRTECDEETYNSDKKYALPPGEPPGPMTPVTVEDSSTYVVVFLNGVTLTTDGTNTLIWRTRDGTTLTTGVDASGDPHLSVVPGPNGIRQKTGYTEEELDKMDKFLKEIEGKEPGTYELPDWLKEANARVEAEWNAEGAAPAPDGKKEAATEDSGTMPAEDSQTTPKGKKGTSKKTVEKSGKAPKKAVKLKSRSGKSKTAKDTTGRAVLGAGVNLGVGLLNQAGRGGGRSMHHRGDHPDMGAPKGVDY